MSKGFACSPSMRACDPLVQRCGDDVGIELRARRPVRKKTTSISTTTTPRLDSLHGEEEVDEAELRVVLAWLGELSIDGDA